MPSTRPAASPSLPSGSLEGGCFCGGLRYRVAGPAWDICHCHCADCRRASGAPFVAWASFHLSAFKLTKGTPGELRYDGRLRTFCRQCGTSIGFWEEGEDAFDVTLASLDQPELLKPTDHIWTEDQLPWVKLGDGLARHARSKG
jgi:hypothetical protein